ncbi:DUF4271 domain-containing protein [Botryobacter ruber]|uniref:DUF4271 domain-containing protein n=1 Tax=Botryobacter ruber TaxID=2171629 RepID=UPI000E0B0C37|nr:DUF4271 domain-containing protein [Botryobacter ruber]
MFKKYSGGNRFFWLLLALASIAWPLQAQVLPLDQKNTITANWLVQEPGATQLVPYVAELHSSHHAVHQWLSITTSQPFLVGFTAKKDQCLFLNNQLIFVADSAHTYMLDLSQHVGNIEPVEGKYLLTVWHPSQHPNVSTFRNQVSVRDALQQLNRRPLTVRVREYVNQNAFIIFLLLICLLYGSLKVTFPADFSSIFSLWILNRPDSSQDMYVRSITWSGILFIVTFSLSLALVIAAIHTNIQHFLLFNQLFPVSEADITTKILFYAALIFLFILLKYIFLSIMGFIFGLEQVVPLQYQEFLRTTLFLGLFLPVVMLVYLAFNATMPERVIHISNLAVTLLLVLTMVRVFDAVNKKAPVLNLHLFSYLCATEVIPLAIMLKLIVFNY